MFYAYVIRSVTTGFIYKGHCTDLEKRLKQHNAGMTRSLTKHRPFEIIYHECFPSRLEAVAREKYFKSAAGRRFLKSIIDK